MLLTKENKDAATSLVENSPVNPKPFPQLTKKRILNSTVKLFGSNKAKNSVFTGSGVIVDVSNSAVTILTALHNLQIWAALTTPPANWGTYPSDFAAAMSIGYGSGDLTFNAAPTGIAKLKSATVPALTTCGTRQNCSYDLMVLTSTDSTFRNYAKASVFNNQQDTLKPDAQKIVDSFNQLLNAAEYHYVQLGYGNIKDDRYKEYLDTNQNIRKEKVQLKYCGPGFQITASNLHYRLGTPSFKVTKSYQQQLSDSGAAPSYLEYPEAIALVGKADSTTAEGDSGGPLYAVDKSSLTNVYLLGVTTGVDMNPAQRPSSWIFKNVISTSVVPYMSSLLP